MTSKFTVCLTFLYGNDHRLVETYHVESTVDNLNKSLEQSLHEQGVLSFELINGGKVFIKTNHLVQATYKSQ